MLTKLKIKYDRFKYNLEEFKQPELIKHDYSSIYKPMLVSTSSGVARYEKFGLETDGCSDTYTLDKRFLVKYCILNGIIFTLYIIYLLLGSLQKTLGEI